MPRPARDSSKRSRGPCCRGNCAATSRPGCGRQGRCAGTRPGPAGCRHRREREALFRSADRDADRAVRLGALARGNAAHAPRRGPFNYAAVHVGSFEDAVLAVMVNDDIAGRGADRRLPVRVAPRHPGPAGVPRAPHHGRRPTRSSPARLRRRWRTRIKDYRPELDLYLLSDRAAEALAGSDEAAPIRRMFHHVEEPMEIHLCDPRRHQGPLRNAVLRQPEEVRAAPDRHLPRAADRARQVGVQVELDPRHGPVLRRQHLLRRVLAPPPAASTACSSRPATSRRRRKPPRAPSARKRAYFGTNGTSTSNKIVVQAVCKPGDIVIVDRNCHKSHHYGFVLAGAQPLLRRGLPADAVLDVRRGAAAHDQEGAARLQGRGQARPRQGHRPDQLHLRRPHVQPARA